MGTADRAPDDREMRHMESVLDEALDAGVVGMSSGLIYEPGKYAQTEELIALAKRLKPVGGLYATHMRNEADQLVASVEEAITIGAAAEVPVQISHHKASGRDNWGLVNDSLALIEAAQHRGESVHADQYPYTAGSTLLRAILDNGAFTNESGGIGRLGPEDVTVASADGKPDWEGRSVASLAAEFELPPRAAAERVLESVPGTTAVVHNMDEADVRRVMQHPSTMIGSDGIPTVQGRPHPRLYNTFARVLGHYVRDVGLFSLETAVYRMTGFSAQKFGLRDRGVVRAGAVADLVLFNPASIIDQGTFDDPNQYPDGIDRVWVNGKLSVNGGELAGPPAGRALRRTNG
ncbi:MAG: amidohydrolase family protein [Pseudomonadota bacterium]